mmetsp:Transcript_25429/g.55889  ORF Transcript_25429/g.55889 Transcript_25429/m.55889 type:complete len:416 (-) Transcript_25429:268-1515(-)
MVCSSFAPCFVWGEGIAGKPRGCSLFARANRWVCACVCFGVCLGCRVRLSRIGRRVMAIASWWFVAEKGRATRNGYHDLVVLVTALPVPCFAANGLLLLLLLLLRVHRVVHSQGELVPAPYQDLPDEPALGALVTAAASSHDSAVEVDDPHPPRRPLLLAVVVLDDVRERFKAPRSLGRDDRRLQKDEEDDGIVLVPLLVVDLLEALDEVVGGRRRGRRVLQDDVPVDHQRQQEHDGTFLDAEVVAVAPHGADRRDQTIDGPPPLVGRRGVVVVGARAGVLRVEAATGGAVIGGRRDNAAPTHVDDFGVLVHGRCRELPGFFRCCCCCCCCGRRRQRQGSSPAAFLRGRLFPEPRVVPLVVVFLRLLLRNAPDRRFDELDACGFFPVGQPSQHVAPVGLYGRVERIGVHRRQHDR